VISTVSADDQPQWGQRYSRNMVSGETGLPDTFDPATGKNIKWVVPLGTQTYSDPAAAEQLSAAADYPQVNRSALKEMHRQTGDLQVENGLATRGLLVRHLVLPENLAGSFEIIDFLTEEISTSTTINIMDQYRPCYNASAHPKINRRPTQKEIQSARQYAIKKGLNVLP
ncbi:unnamed protein product, partial [marine sediment metagenome]